MMKINENLLKDTARQIENSDYIFGTWDLVRPLEAGVTYTFSLDFVPGEGREVFYLYTDPIHHEATFVLSAIQDGKLTYTFTTREDRTVVDEFLRLYQAPNGHPSISRGGKAKLELGTELTIWTPAHADLTPEQMAVLPPYGEYKEIQAF